MNVQNFRGRGHTVPKFFRCRRLFRGYTLAPDNPGAPGSEPFLSGGVLFGAGQTAFLILTLMHVTSEN